MSANTASKTGLFALGLLANLALSSSTFGQSTEIGTEAPESVDQRQFIYSSYGPGSSNWAVGLGIQSYSIVPMLSVQATYGFTDRFDYELKLHSIGVFNSVETGIRYRLVGGEKFSMGFRGNVFGWLYVTDKETTGLGGFVPGLMVSLGGEALQLTVGIDVPLALGGFADLVLADLRAGTGFVPMIRPQLAVEFDFGSVNLYLAGQLYFIPTSDERDTIVLPMAALGLSW